jgi:cephalosporin hydroxylase
MKDLAATAYDLDDVRRDIVADQQAHASTIAAFHRLFYSRRYTHGLTTYHGVPILKNPLDLWVYQEVLWDLRPTLIIETGTAYGGSALFFAEMLDRRGEGRVISIDIEPHTTLPPHPCLSYVTGSSTDPQVVAAIRQIAATHPRVMVVLDSDHSQAHVLDELDAYAPLVTPGQFLVVEDTNIDSRPILDGWMGGHPGPGAAVDTWLPAHPEFTPDALAERFLLTHYPGGWLRRAL